MVVKRTIDRPRSENEFEVPDAPDSFHDARWESGLSSAEINGRDADIFREWRACEQTAGASSGVCG